MVSTNPLAIALRGRPAGSDRRGRASPVRARAPASAGRLHQARSCASCTADLSARLQPGNLVRFRASRRPTGLWHCWRASRALSANAFSIALQAHNGPTPRAVAMVPRSLQSELRSAHTDVERTPGDATGQPQQLATTREVLMSGFGFWRTPEWYARRDARGSTLGHARIHRHGVAQQQMPMATAPNSAQGPDVPVAGSTEADQPAHQVGSRSQA